ncbi:MAG TPA: phosphoribosylanthranilate isomerase [Elusimicrobia bacterium]|nr:phosphoribosylanthranilate isomerase [Elusimicrobiota bacterium]
MTKIKICGITNEKDALWAANAGVDFIGLNFYKNSPRKISVDMAKKITAALPEFVKSVGIFVDEEIETLLKVIKKVQLSAVQLHGNETPEYCAQLREKISGSVPANTLWEGKPQIIKAFGIGGDFRTEQMSQYGNADYFLLDTFVDDLLGGTGQTFNWDLAVETKKLGKPVFLSGGLTPENVSEAIKKVEPFAVDVCSGVERTPTRKDYDKMLSFVKAVRKI